MARTKKYVIGIDLGGTKLLTALLDEDHNILTRIKVKTRVQDGFKNFMETLKDTVKCVLDEAKAGLGELAGIGIGSPGIIDHRSGTILSSPNIPYLKNFAFGPALSREYGIEVVIENDVNAGLYGEYRHGAAQGYENVIGIFMGTGIGGALILNGKLYRGASGAAGEIGHMLMDPQGPVCGCGKRGCLESLAGRLAIAAEAAAIAAKQKAPALYHEAGTDILKMKSSVFRKSIEDGDDEIERLIRAKARLVGMAMTTLVNVLNPDLIVLGGGMIEALPKIILSEAEQVMRECAMGPIAKAAKVVNAKLKDDAIVIGAAQLVRERLKKEGTRA